MIEYISIALKLMVGLSILNVWLLQSKKPTKWRGGDAKTIIEEFKLYGFSKQFCYFIGFLKVGLSILLLGSIHYETLTLISSSGLIILLVGSVIMHLKINDPIYKSFPAALFILMNLTIVYFVF